MPQTYILCLYCLGLSKTWPNLHKIILGFYRLECHQTWVWHIILNLSCDKMWVWMKFVLSSDVYLIKHGFNECDLFSGLARSRNMRFDLGYLCSPLILAPVWLLTYMRRASINVRLFIAPEGMCKPLRMFIILEWSNSASSYVCYGNHLAKRNCLQEESLRSCL